MAIDTELEARLLADPFVSAIVGTKIYPLVLPQNPIYPAIIYEFGDDNPVNNLAGGVARTFPTLMVSCMAVNYKDALALAAAVRNSLSGFIGQLTTLKAVIQLTNETAGLDELLAYRVDQTYAISCNEA